MAVTLPSEGAEYTHAIATDQLEIRQCDQHIHIGVGPGCAPGV